MPNPLEIQKDLKDTPLHQYSFLYLCNKLIDICDCIILIQGEIELIQQEFSLRVQEKLRAR